LDGDADFKRLLDRLSETFSAYLSIDRQIFKQHLGQTTDYQSIIDHLGRVLASFDAIVVELDDYTEDNDVVTTRAYVSRLQTAATILDAIIAGLARQANAQGKYGFFQYRRDTKAYKRAMKGYMQLGGAMNQVRQRY
jgi:hypothetical protein